MDSVYVQATTQNNLYWIIRISYARVIRRRILSYITAFWLSVMYVRMVVNVIIRGVISVMHGPIGLCWEGVVDVRNRMFLDRRACAIVLSHITESMI